MKRRPTAKNKVATVAGRLSRSLDDFALFRNLAASMAPEEKDQWRVSEIALATQEFCKLMGQHWLAISELCDEAEAKAVAVSVSCTIDRNNTPSEVSVKVGYRRNYADSLSAKVPDPDEMELPLFSKKPTGKRPALATYEPGEDSELETKE